MTVDNAAGAITDWYDRGTGTYVAPTSPRWSGFGPFSGDEGRANLSRAGRW